MSDLISKKFIQEALIERISRLNAGGATQAAKELIRLNRLLDGLTPSADRPTGWVPVSERLPETGKDVLVTRAYDGRDDGIKSTVYVEVSACFANGDKWCGFSDEYKMNPQNHTVIAWMPLPEPYKGGDTE